MKKLTYEYIKSQFELEGYKLLSKKFINVMTKVKVQCPDNHTYKVKYNDFQQKHRCPECARLRKKTLKEIKEYMALADYKLLSTEYINSKQKLKTQCDRGHIYYVSWNRFQQGNRCIKCAGLKRKTYEEVKSYIESFGYKLLSTEYINSDSSLEVICDRGHAFRTSWHRFKRGDRCFECWKRNYTEEEIKEFKTYKENVIQISNQNFCKYYHIINPKNVKRGKNKYHLDHIYSIREGFRNNILPKILSNPYNLRMLWCSDNIAKSDRSDQTKQSLYKGYLKFKRGQEKI